jgi:hypothetical protein
MKLQNNTSYGIMLSGGLDSAVLLYLLLKENKNINIQPFSIPKHDGSHVFVPRILEHFKFQFDIEIPDTLLVGDPNLHHSQQSTAAIKQIFKDYAEIDFIYFATNQNPTHDFDYNRYPNGSYPDRVKTSPHPKILMPFIEMHKDEILKLVFDHGQEELLKLTHSCTEQKTGRCGRCFQCNERAWAFRQLDKLDFGIN